MKKLLVSALALMLLAGCSSSSSSEESSSAAKEEESTTEVESTTEETTGAQEATGTATGMGGDVTVTLTVEDGKITAAVIEGADETPSIGQAAFEELQNQIVEAQSAEIDGVSGATVTSTAVKEAAQQAIDELGL